MSVPISSLIANDTLTEGTPNTGAAAPLWKTARSWWRELLTRATSAGMETTSTVDKQPAPRRIPTLSREASPLDYRVLPAISVDRGQDTVGHDRAGQRRPGVAGLHWKAASRIVIGR